MNNSINSVNPSFGANLVTTISGRHNVMEKVAERFAEKTKNFTGNLYVKRNEVDYPKALVVNLNNKNEYITHEHKPFLLGQNLEKVSDVTEEVIDKIAEGYASILRALKLDTAYQSVMSGIDKNIKETIKAGKKNMIALKKAKESGNKSAEDMYSMLLEQNKNRIEILKNESNEASTRYYNMLGGMYERNPVLGAWAEVVLEELAEG